jgi:tetratricopeptide (TPR) repeat protein
MHPQCGVWPGAAQIDRIDQRRTSTGLDKFVVSKIENHLRTVLGPQKSAPSPGPFNSSPNALEALIERLGFPPNARAFAEMGKFLLELGHYDEAVEALARAIRLNPLVAQTWKLLGVSCAAQGRFEKAKEALERAVRLDSEDVWTWVSLAAACGKLRLYDEALRATDRALRLDRSNAEAWINRGAAASGLGWIEQALEAYDRAIKLNPALAKAWYNQACLMARVGNTADMFFSLAKAVSLEPSLAERARNDPDFGPYSGTDSFARCLATPQKRAAGR